MNNQESTYYLFIDESGDHGLTTLNPDFPVFLLCGVLLAEPDYFAIRDEFNRIKGEFWKNKQVIFHSRDIRKCEKEFQILFDMELSVFYKIYKTYVLSSVLPFSCMKRKKRTKSLK